MRVKKHTMHVDTVDKVHDDDETVSVLEPSWLLISGA
jgi:hypothetical protein